jgi:enterochelin esterase-like enzyme
MPLVLIIAAIAALGGISQPWRAPASSSAAKEATPKAQRPVGDEILAKEGVQSLKFRSPALDREMRLQLYLPRGYDAKRKYPVLYLFHGYTGNESTWMTALKADEAANALLEEGLIEPLIIVSPQIDNSFGVNTADRYKVLNPQSPVDSLYEGRYEDYIVHDLIPYIESRLSVISGKEGRFIGGLSMGGFIAMHTAFSYPDRFSKVGGHSPALLLDDGNLAWVYRWLYPDERTRKQRDPLELARTSKLDGIRVYMDSGRSDELEFYKGARKMAELLDKRGVDYQYRLNDGYHNESYWHAHVKEYLLFYAGK